jgi:hypothetical protein
MKLSHDEDAFLRRWMYDEVHYAVGPGPAKAFQVRHGASPADLAAIIAAAIPDPAEQEAAGTRTAALPIAWPWTKDSFQNRLAEARSILSARLPTRVG